MWVTAINTADRSELSVRDLGPLRPLSGVLKFSDGEHVAFQTHPELGFVLGSDELTVERLALPFSQPFVPGSVIQHGAALFGVGWMVKRASKPDIAQQARLIEHRHLEIDLDRAGFSGVYSIHTEHGHLVGTTVTRFPTINDYCYAGFGASAPSFVIDNRDIVSVSLER
jgi:hypothetical protein